LEAADEERQRHLDEMEAKLSAEKAKQERNAKLLAEKKLIEE
jgi:hypothetical protein